MRFGACQEISSTGRKDTTRFLMKGDENVKFIQEKKGGLGRDPSH